MNFIILGKNGETLVKWFIEAPFIWSISFKIIIVQRFQDHTRMFPSHSTLIQLKKKRSGLNYQLILVTRYIHKNQQRNKNPT